MSELTLSTVTALLRCPHGGGRVTRDGNGLVAESGRRYPVTESGIALFGEEDISPDAAAQQKHYDTIASAYVRNLEYPHTREYMSYLDGAFMAALGDWPVGVTAEICCGRGEAFRLLRDRIEIGVGLDISRTMLEEAQRDLANARLAFVQGDATRMPLADSAFDTVFMFGGIHHVPARDQLFREVFRILRPGGRFYYREPVSDFVLWRALRAVIYRISPTLDHLTERPLLSRETIPVLEAAGLRPLGWHTYGFIGFCLFMNSDVLFINRPLRFMPGIRAVTRGAVALDELTRRLPGMATRGLQVVGMAEKPADRAAEARGRAAEAHIDGAFVGTGPLS